MSHEFLEALTVACSRAVRVLRLEHVGDDTFVILEDGEASLATGETLKMLLTQLSRRT